ncbi:MAG: nickel-responsive transcriptional regulator NikR [Synergistales bacterium]|jgi:CopG family nickel-responsive transcriptional regulator
MEEMVRFSVSMPESLAREFDRWIEKKKLKNRSDALRQIIRDYIGQTMWEVQEGEAYGTFTFSYDHHSRDASREITRLQHDFGECIVCTTHVHIDHDTCMEVVLLRGATQEIHRFVEAASSLGCIRVGLPSLLPPF